MKTSPANKEETSRQRHFDFEPDINDLFGAAIALTVFAEKTFERASASKDERGRSYHLLEEDEKEALFYLIYEIRNSARSLRSGFYDGEANP